MGSADFESTQEGYSFLFASAENLALFEANPTAYYPMYGGFCAYGMACEEWWTISDMAADANPNVWAVIDDRLFTFRGEDPYQKSGGCVVMILTGPRVRIHPSFMGGFRLSLDFVVRLHIALFRC